jgi:hypothetical protein
LPRKRLKKRTAKNAKAAKKSKYLIERSKRERLSRASHKQFAGGSLSHNFATTRTLQVSLSLDLPPLFPFSWRSWRPWRLSRL